MPMYYEETGKKVKPSIVFVHGGGISGWMWHQQVKFFSDYHCLIPDLPEQGKSIHERLLSLTDCADRIADLIEKKGNDHKAHLVGHSLGGKVVVELLSRRPELVDHAVVASALFRPMFILKLIHRPSVYKLTASLLRYRWLSLLTAKQMGFSDKLYFSDCLENLHKNLTPDLLYRIYDQLYQYRKLPDNLADVKAAVLVMAGEKEPGPMKQSVLDIAEALPNSKGILLKKANHTYPWTEYEKFNDLVRSWISDQKFKKDFVRNLP